MTNKVVTEVDRTDGLNWRERVFLKLWCHPPPDVPFEPRDNPEFIESERTMRHRPIHWSGLNLFSVQNSKSHCKTRSSSISAVVPAIR